MGNEASLEGGEGLGAFPEGAAAAGDGGGPAAPLQSLVPAGVEADLSQLSEEERRQIAAVMSRAQGLPRGNLAGAEPPPMQRHARKISPFSRSSLPPSPSPRGGAGGESQYDLGPPQPGPAFHFAGRGREGAAARARAPGRSLHPLAFPLQRSLMVPALPVSVGCALLSSLALIWGTGSFCVGAGRDVQTPFWFSVCGCVLYGAGCPTAPVVAGEALPGADGFLQPSGERESC